MSNPKKPITFIQPSHHEYISSESHKAKNLVCRLLMNFSWDYFGDRGEKDFRGRVIVFSSKSRDFTLKMIFNKGIFLKVVVYDKSKVSFISYVLFKKGNRVGTVDELITKLKMVL